MHDTEEQRREKYGEEGTVFFQSTHNKAPVYQFFCLTGPASPTYRNMDRVEEGPVAAAVESAMV